VRLCFPSELSLSLSERGNERVNIKVKEEREKKTCTLPFNVSQVSAPLFRRLVVNNNE
jgi:hypothetical protein